MPYLVGMSKQSESGRFEMRLSKALAERVDRWRKQRPGFMSRAEAMRTLAERALDAADADAGTGPGVRAKEGKHDAG